MSLRALIESGALGLEGLVLKGEALRVYPTSPVALGTLWPGSNSPLTTAWKDLSGHGNDGTLEGFAGDVILPPDLAVGDERTIVAPNSLLWRGFPSGVLCDDGTILVAFKQGSPPTTEYAAGDIYLMRWTESGGWGAPTILYAHVSSDEQWQCGTLVRRSSDGRIFLYARQYDNTTPANDLIYTSYSDDNGATFSTQVVLPAIAGIDALGAFGENNCEFTELLDGTLLISAYGRISPGDSYDSSFCLQSSDGLTWTLRSVIWDGQANTTGANETAILKVGDGSLLCVIRFEESGLPGSESSVRFCRSTDDGLTWSTPAIIGSGIQLDAPVLWNLPDDTILLVGRVDLTTVELFHSLDYGSSWQSPATLSGGNYSGFVEDAVGTLHILYTHDTTVAERLLPACWAGSGTTADLYRLVFDGVSNYVTVPDAAELRPGNGDYTAEVRVCVPFGATDYWRGGILDKGWSTDTIPAGSWSLHQVNGDPNTVEFQDTATLRSVTFSHQFSALSTGCRHLVVTRTAGAYNGYIDKVHDWGPVTPALANLNSTGPVHLGVNGIVGGYDSYIQSAIAAARIYLFALTAAQVAQNYAAGPNAKAPTAGAVLELVAGLVVPQPLTYTNYATIAATYAATAAGSKVVYQRSGTSSPIIVTPAAKSGSWQAAVVGAWSDPLRLFRDFCAVGDLLIPLGGDSAAYLKVA